MARRRFDTFSLSFLDIMSCGFGAVVLFFMIISATIAIRSDELNKKLSEKADSLLVEVSEGDDETCGSSVSLLDVAVEEEPVDRVGAFVDGHVGSAEHVDRFGETRTEAS